jgi:peptidoglycan/LPS O-acetylase OafA/YrhL
LIAGYLPTFFFGLLLARSEPVRERLLDAWRICAVIVSGAGLFYALVCLGLIDPLEQHVRVIGASLCPPAAFVLILRSALQVRRVPAFVGSLSDASYTIYLLHVPAAVAINTRMAPLGFHPNVQYALTIVIAGVGCWLIHRLVVRRSATAALLLNGRLPRRQPPASLSLAGQAAQ